MRSAQISFKNKKVVIVGGGKQALKKVQDFLKEEAEVKVITLYAIDAISQDIITLKPYDKTDIEGAFLVFACTNDKKLNHQIVVDANMQNSLSASVHKDDEATYHPLRFKEYNQMHLALSTNGAYPAYMDVMLKTFEEIYYKQFENTLEDLRFIREHVLCLNIENKTTLLRSIAKVSKNQIAFYKEAIKTDQAVIFVFHGNEEETSARMIENVLATIKQPAFYAYLKEDTKHSIYTIKEHLSLLGIENVTYQPMVLEKGYCFHKIKEITTQCEDILINERVIKDLICAYAHLEQVLFVVHDTKNKTFVSMLENYLPYNIKVMTLKDEIPVLDKDKDVHLTGLFILSATHLKEDVLGDNGIYGKLIKMGYSVHKDSACLLEKEHFKKCIYNKYK